MESPSDTIAAVATPVGRGGIGVVRVSGPRASVIAERITGRTLRPRVAHQTRFFGAEDQEVDNGLAIFFAAPRSFTGEDVLELHCHGSPVVLDMVLERTLQLGARLARPGEFSERAFLNDKLDLAQAEAIADLIEAKSRRAAVAALRSLEGVFSRRVDSLIEALVALRVFVESTLDFPDEDIEFISQGRVAEQLDSLARDIAVILAEAESNARLRAGLRVVIAGLPNAGKSSLLNALSQRESAIVTDIPGTTRDIIRENILIDGMPIEVIDTAGLRDAADKVEAIGIDRARAEMGKADVVLLVIDSSEPEDGQLTAVLPKLPADTPIVYVYNKIDMRAERGNAAGDKIFLSALTGEGIDLLRQKLKAMSGLHDAEAGEFSVRRRHLDALRRAQQAVEQARHSLTQGSALELSAEDLRAAQLALGEITGEFTNEDLLTRIFSTFCIGK